MPVIFSSFVCYSLYRHISREVFTPQSFVPKKLCLGFTYFAGSGDQLKPLDTSVRGSDMKPKTWPPRNSAMDFHLMPVADSFCLRDIVKPVTPFRSAFWRQPVLVLW